LEGKFSFFDKIDRIKNPRINGSLCMIPSSYVHHFQFEICWTKFLSFDTIEGQNRKSLTKTKIQFSAGEKKGEKQPTERQRKKKENTLNIQTHSNMPVYNAG
jgi:hypothetical protein